MEIEHIFSLRMFSIQGLACGLVLELHSQTEIELDSFILTLSPVYFTIYEWKIVNQRAYNREPMHVVKKPAEFVEIICIFKIP